ncbi:MAG: pyridoxine 5'-phosphate synthase [Planctomycetota bacterium]|nr:pyridoxine 5'-phosphate synthase [Planctomycetota bacterium]
MIRLGVNIDHVATVRQARGERFPEPLAAAHAAILGGADLITMHLREDRRHIQDRDVELVREALAVPLNLEMACTEAMVAFARRIRPDHVCLVPEKREEVTTEGGLDVAGQRDNVKATVDALRADGIVVSVFVDPDEQAMLAANDVGAEVVEIHTGRYANARGDAAVVHEFMAIRKAATTAHQLGLRVHAGHGLTYRNVWRVAALPEVEELNIGFALVARSLFVGLPAAVREMRDEMLRAREAARQDL